jgi:hypothetical protein
VEITLYRRSYPVADAPVAWSFSPHSPGQRHTYAAGGSVNEAERGEVRVVAPEGATLDAVKGLLSWGGGKSRYR